LQIDSTTQYERKEIITTTSVSNPHYGALGRIRVTDKNQDVIGGLHSYFTNDGAFGIGIFGYNPDNSQAPRNQLFLGHDIENQRVVKVSDASA
jgi:hypothetical protein